MKKKLPVVSSQISFLFISGLSLYMFLINDLQAQTYDETVASTTRQGSTRPLRSIRNDTIQQITDCQVNTGQWILLTPENLEQPLTMRYIEEFSSPGGIKWLNSIIKNGKIYLPFVREEISKRGMPQELLFLPFIESGYISTAKSKSGAVGIWQFMLNSVPPGMKVNEMIDERRDFQKSTIAALRKLEENYRALGDWPLALAAYNAGLGAVNRMIQKTKINDYWILCEKKEFKNETIQYLPKLLAVSYILSMPRRFNVDYWPETIEWTTIKPGRQASLDLIASETGVDRNLLHRMNLELLYGITMPDKSYELKVPLAYSEKISSLLEREDLKLLHYYSYKVQYGDTLSVLSRHYGISIDMIEQHNPGIKGRYLKIGEILIIPAFKDVKPYQGETVLTTRTASPAATPEVQNQVKSTFEGVHVVVKGETLWSLAIRYGVDAKILAAENNMELNQILSIGKILKVPIIE